MSKQKDHDIKKDPNPDLNVEKEAVVDIHKECEEEVRQVKNAYLRALADYKNLENRVQNERNQMQDTIKKNIVDRLFPVLDNLNQAEVFMKDPGLQMVAKSFSQALAEIGVEEIQLLGQDYDPYTAEVIEVVPGDADNIIVEVLQKGYKLNGSVIRHGKVKVSKKQE